MRGVFDLKFNKSIFDKLVRGNVPHPQKKDSMYSFLSSILISASGRSWKIEEINY